MGTALRRFWVWLTCNHRFCFAWRLEDGIGCYCSGCGKRVDHEGRALQGSPWDRAHPEKARS